MKVADEVTTRRMRGEGGGGGGENGRVITRIGANRNR